MTLLSDIPAFLRGDADVADGKYIEPEQAYIENVEYATVILDRINNGNVTTLNLANKGITEFHINDSIVGTMFFNNGVEVDLSDNLMDDAAVQSFFNDISSIISSSGGPACVFNTYGLSMGTPLSGGTAGGWTLNLTGYVPGTEGDASFYPGQYYPQIQAAVLFVGYFALAESNVDLDFPDYRAIYIGVQDSPTPEAMLDKFKELYIQVNGDGSLSRSGVVLTYVDTVPREWYCETFSPGIAVTYSGVNPASNAIDTIGLIYGCSGTYMSPDGVTQVNF